MFELVVAGLSKITIVKLTTFTLRENFSKNGVIFAEEINQPASAVYIIMEIGTDA